jgi:RNA polymerase sigma-70 factor, ECF subfamily
VNGPALERVFRAASGRIIAALAARFRDLGVAEDAFSEACLRALRAWAERGIPDDPAAWLYRVAHRVALDARRQQKTAQHHAPDMPTPDAEPNAEETMIDDSRVIPDERLRLIFICCHPAVAPEARAALTLRLVCGLTVTEIARAFLIEEATLAQRLVRAKRKITDAGVPFELPAPEFWPERLEAVLSTLEVAYSKAHEDAAGAGSYAGFAAEMLHLTKLLVDLIPAAGEAYALAALARYAEARRPARVDADGVMIPLSQQDPKLWRWHLIDEADKLLARAIELDPQSARTLQAALQSAWCARRSLDDPAPWPQVLRLYDRLLSVRDDPIVRLNRMVALAEVVDPAAALAELQALDSGKLTRFVPYQAVRADLLARVGRLGDAREAYEAVLALDPPPAERHWVTRQLAHLNKR